MTVSPRARQAGVCVIRFEPEPDRWLVSVSVIWPLGADNRRTDRERVWHFSDKEQAIAAVTEQLRRAIGRSPPTHVETRYHIAASPLPEEESQQGLERSRRDRGPR